MCLAWYTGRASGVKLEVIKRPPLPNRIDEPEAGQGTEGGRSTDSTGESGPMRSGNRAEDKTLKTGKT